MAPVRGYLPLVGTYHLPRPLHQCYALRRFLYSRLHSFDSVCRDPITRLARLTDGLPDDRRACCAVRTKSSKKIPLWWSMVQMLVCSVMEMSHSQLQHHNNIEHDDGMAFPSADLGLLLLLCLAALCLNCKTSSSGLMFDVPRLEMCIMTTKAVHIVAYLVSLVSRVFKFYHFIRSVKETQTPCYYIM